MKFLLTSQSIYNRSIESALRELLPKPSDQCVCVYVTTSQNGAVGDKSWFIRNLNDAFDVGWKSFEIIDIAAMVNLSKEMWWTRIEAADVLFVGGGANYYLSYWLEKSGLADALPNLLQNKVYVGSSAGSIAVANSLKSGSEALQQLAAGDSINLEVLGPVGQRSPRALKLIDVEFRPHYQADQGHNSFITDELLQTLANQAKKELYAVDDNSALKIVDNEITVVSEGKWRLFTPANWLLQEFDNRPLVPAKHKRFKLTPMNTYVITSAIIQKDEHFLILKRSSRTKFAPGQWEFVSGFIKEHESAEDAVHRELSEELKCDGTIVGILPVYEIVDKDARWVVVPFEIELNQDEIQLSDEHESYRWATKKEVAVIKELSTDLKQMKLQP